MLLDKTYTEFKEDIYRRLGDLHKLKCSDFNALKIVLDGLKVRYSSRGKIRHTIFLPLWQQGLMSFLHRIKSGNSSAELLQSFEAHRHKQVMLVSMMSKDPGGNYYSPHYHRILNALPDPSQVYYASDRVVPSGMKTDASLFPLFAALRSVPFDADEKKLLSEIRSVVAYIERELPFSATEVDDIKSAFQIFFQQYRVWKAALTVLNPGTCFFRCHYHREGMLLALKRKKVKLIELQHGLIAPEDIFYIFPEPVKAIRNECLFADELWVYGDYWKQVVARGTEYPPERVHTIGYYNEVRNAVNTAARQSFVDKLQGKKVILVTCQTGSHQYFTDYVRFLSGDLKRTGDTEHIIVVKPHSNEKLELYTGPLSGVENVIIYQDDIDFVLSHSRLLITIYSTTVFDGMRYRIPSYSLLVPEYLDYVDTFVKNGFSRPLRLDESPLGTAQEQVEFTPEKYYGAFAPELVRNAVVEQSPH